MAEKRPRPPIVAQPRRKFWREHMRPSGGDRPTVWTSIDLPNGDMRGKTFTRATRVRLRLQDRAESVRFLFLPGTKIARPCLAYLQDMVSLPLIFAEVESRLWRSRQPGRRYPSRPVREARHG